MVPRQVALIVDDHRVTRQLLARLLARDGWSVVLARHGQEALEVLERERVAIIFLDLEMPVMDGFVFLDRVSAEPALREIPIAVITTRDLDQRERAQVGPARGYLQKGSIGRRELAEVYELLSVAPLGDTAAA